MRNWQRRVRGAIGIGITWAAAWSAVGALPRWVLGINADAPFPLIFGILGFFAGVTFSGLLVLTERRRGFEAVTLQRFAAWGAVGGAAMAAVFARAVSMSWGDLITIAPVFAVASAVCAAGSLALARRAETRSLPHLRADAGNSALAEPEARKLL
jgi:hypothetical protein